MSVLLIKLTKRIKTHTGSKKAVSGFKLPNVRKDDTNRVYENGKQIHYESMSVGKKFKVIITVLRPEIVRKLLKNLTGEAAR